MTKPTCKAFRQCIQPHICEPCGACIWGQRDEQPAPDIDAALRWHREAFRNYVRIIGEPQISVITVEDGK